jgi:surface antigen
MIDLLLIGLAQPKPEPIFKLEPVKIELVIKKEKPKPTKAEQLAKDIKNDVNDCEPLYYISAEDASCLPKPVRKPVKTAPTVAYSGFNGYEYGQCTYGVASWRSVPSNLGHAKTWGYRWAGVVSDVPIVNAVAWSTRGYYGHVALVLAVDGNRVLIREQNYDWRGSVREVWVDVGTYRYLH